MTHLYARHDAHSGMDMDMDSGSTSTSMGMMGMKAYFHATIPSTDYLWFESWVPSSVGPVIGACIGVFLLAVGERALVAVQRAMEGEWRRDALRRLSSSQSASSSTTSSSSSSYKQAPPQDDTIPAYNPTRSHTSSTLEKRPASGSEDAEIVPVLPSDDHLVASAARPSPTTTTSPSTAAATGPTYLPRALVSALTNPSRKNRYSVPFIWQNDVTRGLLAFCTKGLGYLLMLVVMTFNVWFITAVCLGAGVGEALFGRHGYAH